MTLCLSLLRHLLGEHIGTRVVGKLKEELTRGVLRADLILKTDSDIVILFEFERTLDAHAFIQVFTHTFLHMHLYKKKLLVYQNLQTNHIAVLIAIKSSNRVLEALEKYPCVFKIEDGIYRISIPYLSAVVIVLSRDISRWLIEVPLSGIRLPEGFDVEKYVKLIRTPEFWEIVKREPDCIYAQITKEVLRKIGSLVLLLNLDFNYFYKVYEGVEVIASELAKDILMLMSLLFLKEVKRMKVLSKLREEDIRDLVESMGLQKVIDAVGIERVIDAVGIEKVIEAVGVEKVIKWIGPEKVMNIAVKELLKSKKGREELLKLLERIKEKGSKVFFVVESFSK